MTINNIINLILEENFKYVKGNIPNMHVLANAPSQEILDVCIIVDNTEGRFIHPDVLNNFQNAIEQKFLFNGYKKVSTFFIFISDNLERDKVFILDNLNFWFVDWIGKRIIIYDDQPDDYYHLRAKLEKKLSAPLVSNSYITHIPIVTISIIATNIIVFLIMVFLPDHDYLLRNGGSYWKYIYENHEFYRLFTCMFLHFNSEHIMNNMITLAFIGAETEKFLGHVRFLIIYLLSGLGASIMSSLYYMHNSPNTITLSAGASGAIFGMLGSLIIITLLSKNLRRNIHPINLLLITVLSIGNGYFNSSIDNVAHIGGLLFGIIITFISCLYRKNILK